MIPGALLVLVIAAGWTLLALVVGVGIGRAAAGNRRGDDEAYRELERRRRLRANAHESMVDEHRD